ncbi:unnamed protein product [Chironomus riparius]|uniref:Secreted protein n=1 Tax=Chironomus riparius TaxID=315576 RepID=A0A9N9WUQ2_9DIPT|nr:unnamed protein product [Chironomus riparius]
MESGIIFFVLSVLLILCCMCCTCICQDTETPAQNIPTNQQIQTPLITREIYFIRVDETSNNQTNQQENQRTNEIPPEYANMKPQETVSGWQQGSGISGVPVDARVPANAQPPTISDDE